MVNEDDKNRNDKDDQTKLAEHVEWNWWLKLRDVRTSCSLERYTDTWLSSNWG